MQFSSKLSCVMFVIAVLLVNCYGIAIEGSVENGAGTSDEVLGYLLAGNVAASKTTLQTLLDTDKNEAEDAIIATLDDPQLVDTLIQVLVELYQEPEFDTTPLSNIYGDIYDINRTAIDFIISEIVTEISKLEDVQTLFSEAIVYAYTSRAAVLYGSAHLREPIEEGLQLAIETVGAESVCPVVEAAVEDAGKMRAMLTILLKKAPGVVQCVAGL